LPDEAFKAELRRLNGTPESVLQDDELMTLVLPLLRNDFALSEMYQSHESKRLDCQVTAFGGQADQEVSLNSLQAWRNVTTGKFRIILYSGDHFYLHKCRHALMKSVAKLLLT
jgi:medium-chain acyl-[acyl-carrier-protein] hydrolase